MHELKTLYAIYPAGGSYDQSWVKEYPPLAGFPPKGTNIVFPSTEMSFIGTVDAFDINYEDGHIIVYLEGAGDTDDVESIKEVGLKNGWKAPATQSALVKKLQRA